MPSMILLNHMKKKCLKQKNKGFTLVETLVAIAIFSLSILGLMAVLGSGISSTNYAKNKIIAGYLAQEGIEYVRNVRDNYVLYNASGGQAGWDNFRALTCTAGSPCGYNSTSYPGFGCSWPGQTCRLYVSNGSYEASLSGGTDSGFVRNIWIEPINANESKIFSRVSWTQGSGNQSVTFSEHLFNWVE